MKGEEAMEKTARRKPRRYAKPLVLRLFTALLLIISIAFLYFVVLLTRIRNMGELIASRYDRLYSSVYGAQLDASELTDSYDRWRYQRLNALKYIHEKNAYSPEEFCMKAESYYPGISLCLINREDHTVIGRTGEIPEPLVLSEIIEASEENEYGLNTSHFNRDYYQVLSDGTLAVLHTEPREYWDYMDNIYTKEEVLSYNMNDGSNFFLGVKDGKVAYTANTDLSNKPIAEVLTVLRSIPYAKDDNDQKLELVTLDNNPMIGTVRQVEDIGIDLYYFIPISTLSKECLKILIPVFVVLVIFVVLFEEYLYNLRLDHAAEVKGGKAVSEIRYKGTASAALAILAVGTTAFSSYSLYGLSTFIENYKPSFAFAEYTIKDNSECQEDLQKAFDAESLKDAHMVGAYLSDYPEQRVPEVLNEFCDIFFDSYIMLFDTNGRETVTNADYAGYSISNDPENHSYRFQPLKHGVAEVVGPLEKNELTGEEEQIIGVSTKDETGHIDGFLEKVFYPAALVRALEHATLSGTFDNSVVSNVFDCFLIDSETGKFVIFPYDYTMIGRDADDYGFSEKIQRGDFCGYVTTNGERYFMASKALDGLYLYVGIAVSDIFDGRGFFTGMSVLTALILILVISAAARGISVERKLTAEEVQKSADTQLPSDMVYVVVSNEVQNAFSPIARWKNMREKWQNMNAEQKLGKLISEVALLLAVMITVIIIFRDKLFGQNSILSFILEGNWPRGINPFSISASVILFVEAFVVIALLRTVLNLLAGVLTPRAKTLCHLIRSFIEYGGAIAVTYISLGFLGVDVRALSASVGFLALIVGFGAKSLITDIVAGIFIIFEKEFQVGDIVNIGGYTGMVKEIGLRTTKIVSWDKNVKIINNHDISNVVNMTMRNSFAIVSFTIPVTVSIEELEDIFRSELPKLCEKYPQIIGVPYFAGVLSFSGNRMKCRVSAEVKELERGELENNLHREVQEILQRHGIPMK